MNKQNISQIRINAEKKYKSFTTLCCPYFKENITFNSEGFNHIRYRKSRNERHLSVQKMRYILLPLAVEVIKNSKTLQEHEIKNQFVTVMKNKRKEKVLKEIHFFGFIAIIKNYKIKVIIRQVGNGNKHFWSIIPNWKTRRSKDGATKRILHTGDLKQD